MLPQKPVRYGVRCVHFPPLSAASELAVWLCYQWTREVRTLQVGGRPTGRSLGTTLCPPARRSRINPQENWKRLSHFPPWLFMIIHIFKWKGKNAKKETLKWAKKGKKKSSEKNFRGKSCSILKSFEGCKVPRFSHLLHTFFSDFFSMFNICEMTAFLYLKLDAFRFVGRGWWYSYSLEKVCAYRAPSWERLKPSQADLSGLTVLFTSICNKQK